MPIERGNIKLCLTMVHKGKYALLSAIPDVMVVANTGEGRQVFAEKLNAIQHLSKISWTQTFCQPHCRSHQIR